MFSNEQKKIYVNKKGLVCPYCNSKSLSVSRGADTMEPDLIDMDVMCDDCNKEWKEIYKLLTIEEI